ncbi:MAG: response regulator transcription factor [Dehalococcoidia bacterium]|nr:response regulator transcription factor [Dehalococcoidia bacterium]
MTDMVLRKLQELMKGKAAWISDVLSERDTTILSMIASGATKEQIGLRLNIATATVRNNITAMRSKLGLSPQTTRAQLVSYAFRHGLLDDSQVDSSSSSTPG